MTDNNDAISATEAGMDFVLLFPRPRKTARDREIAEEYRTAVGGTLEGRIHSIDRESGLGEIRVTGQDGNVSGVHHFAKSIGRSLCYWHSGQDI